MRARLASTFGESSVRTIHSSVIVPSKMREEGVSVAILSVVV